MPKGVKTKKAASWITDVGLKAFAVFLLFGLTALAYSKVQFPTGGPNPVTGLVGQYVGATTTNFNTVLTGYQAASNKCKDDYQQYPRVHVCTAEEVINTYNNNDLNTSFPPSSPDRVWLNNGPPSAAVTRANDCQGWTKNSNKDYGNIWVFTRKSAYISRCNVPSYPFACCQ